MKDFLVEIENLVMPSIDTEVIGLFVAVALIYIMLRYQSKYLRELLKKRPSLIDKKKAAAIRESEQFSTFVATKEQLYPKNTEHRTITDIPGPILIADDDQNMCEVLADIIERELKGFSIETANDGEEALQHINRCSPSLLILDLKMPRKNGFEVLKELSTRSERFPILVISSNPISKEEIVQEVYMSGDRFEYLHKIFSPKEFIKVIQKMLNQQDNYTLRMH